MEESVMIVAIGEAIQKWKQLNAEARDFISTYGSGRMLSEFSIESLYEVEDYYKSLPTILRTTKCSDNIREYIHQYFYNKGKADAIIPFK